MRFFDSEASREEQSVTAERMALTIPQPTAAHAPVAQGRTQRSIIHQVECPPPIRTIRYVIITPVRNEALHIQETLQSIVGQTVKPVAWIIVNDGSTDETPAIIERFSRENAWIYVVHRPDRGFRKSGTGVMEAFYDGYRALPSSEWDFLVKFDGDLSVDSDYFEKCFDRFSRSPRLGIGGGWVEEPAQVSKSNNSHPTFHVRGATKIYRRACWQEIGDLPKT